MKVIDVTHVSLFTGIGGLDLAAEAAGFETILQVEREPYALKVLERHWPHVPRITDVREVTKESVDGHVTVVSGGFPCQPFSSAGRRRGAGDDRYLWPEMLRIVDELQPAWIIGENVSGLLSIDGGMEIGRMLAALEARDYEIVGVLHYPAAGVGAPHKRDRIFIVAHANSTQCQGGRISSGVQTQFADADSRSERRETGKIVANVGDPYTWQTESRMGRVADEFPNRMDGGRSDANEERETEPAGIPRVATGLANRAARLKALGNAVVPAQAFPIFAAIAHAEQQKETK